MIRKQAMILTIIEFLNNNLDIASAIPNFTTVFTDLKNNAKEIQAIRHKQGASIKGLTAAKEEMRKQLATNTYDVICKVRAYAVTGGDKILEKEVYYTPSDFTRSKQSSIADKVKVVHARASEHLKELEPYGISEKTLADLKELSEMHAAAIPELRTYISSNKVLTSRLDALFEEASRILKVIDVLVDIVRLSHPIFYQAYRNNRKIVNTGGGTLALKVRVVDAKSGESLKGVTATLMLKSAAEANSLQKGKKKIVKKTAAMGGFFIKNLTEGIYLVSFDKIGFVFQTVEVHVAGNEMNVLLVKMEAI
ncbi:hypothetical protein [uncultured Acetobacteroides sp.]|uniref:hypothetical protein n=1 Tax=uncultured Acetobacteroides sp. TaxID=1760811 RepID=UPI002AA5ED6E|nr:hypothetical protein [uncultured Acetobacteroides sp.]